MAAALTSCAGTAPPALSPLVLMFLDKPILASPHSHWVTAVAFSADGSTVATGAGDGLVRLWDANNGLLRSVATGDAQRGISAVAFSPDGRSVAAVGGILGADVLLWGAASGRKVGEAPSPLPPKGTADYMVYKDRPPSARSWGRAPCGFPRSLSPATARPSPRPARTGECGSGRCLPAR
jgi:hypothetical protein